MGSKLFLAFLSLIINFKISVSRFMAIKFPCKICANTVATNNEAIYCDKCNFWVLQNKFSDLYQSPPNLQNNLVLHKLFRFSISFLPQALEMTLTPKSNGALLANYVWKSNVPSSSPAASYVQRWPLCSNHLPNI